MSKIPKYMIENDFIDLHFDKFKEKYRRSKVSRETWIESLKVIRENKEAA